MTVRFALLGAGRIGKVHARAVGSNPDAKLVAVADAFEKAAKELAVAYGAEVRTIDAIEKAGDIDAVVEAAELRGEVREFLAQNTPRVERRVGHRLTLSTRDFIERRLSTAG